MFDLATRHVAGVDSPESVCSILPFGGFIAILDNPEWKSIGYEFLLKSTKYQTSNNYFGMYVIIRLRLVPISKSKSIKQKQDLE